MLAMPLESPGQGQGPDADIRGVQTPGVPGVRGSGGNTPDPGGAWLAWSLVWLPQQHPSTPTQLGAEPVITLSSGFLCLPWPALACLGLS